MLRSFATLALVTFVLSFCGISEKLKGLSGNSASNTPTTSNNSTAVGPKGGDIAAEKPSLSSSQQDILSSGAEVKWDEQGISWVLPKGWKKMDVKRESFNYSSPDNAFLLVNISSQPDTFPMEVSQKAYYEQALQQLKNGKYQSVKMVEIDGIKGVEFVESPAEGKDDPRRHQFIAYRRYLGEVQQLNVMTSTRSSNFDKHEDDFAAIMYSMKVVK